MPAVRSNARAGGNRSVQDCEACLADRRASHRIATAPQLLLTRTRRLLRLIGSRESGVLAVFSFAPRSNASGLMQLRPVLALPPIPSARRTAPASPAWRPDAADPSARLTEPTRFANRSGLR